MICAMRQVTELPSPIDRTIAATVRALIHGRGVTAGDVATACGIARTSMFNKLKGTAPFKASEVYALARYFQVSVADLYSGMGGAFPGPVPASGRSLPRLDSNQEPAGQVRLRAGRLHLTGAALPAAA